MSVIEKLAAKGIRLKNYSPGNHYALCPECSDSRKGHNKRKPCLSVAIGPWTLRSGSRVEDGEAVFHCLHCDFVGGTSERTSGDFGRIGSSAQGARVGPRRGFGDGNARPARKRWW